MIVILTALQCEYLAVRKHMTEVQTHQHAAGTLFETGVVAGQHIALAVVGEGNTSAAALTERAITEFQPGAVLFVGIAGALRDWLVLGDVVVATRVYAYHGGRSTDHSFRTRPRVWDSSHHLEQIARSVARTDDWRSAIPAAPVVHFNPIAAGEVLLDSRRSAVANHLRDRFEDAVAIEMESAGMANAGHLNRDTPTLTIRGISDFADGAKDRTAQPELAAGNAAAFAVAVVAKLTEAGGPPTGNRAAADRTVATNVASGNSHVTAQFGIVRGDVHFTAQADQAPGDDRRPDDGPS